MQVVDGIGFEGSLFLNAEARGGRAFASYIQAEWRVGGRECQSDHRSGTRSRSQVGHVCRDRDSVYTKTFDKALKSKRVEVTKVAFRAPNMNAYAERFVQTIQGECLDHFIVCGTRHFDYLCREFLEHYHKERPHQGLENCVPLARTHKRKKKTAAPAAATLPRLVTSSASRGLVGC
jgi:hypothetical protein